MYVNYQKIVVLSALTSGSVAKKKNVGNYCVYEDVPVQITLLIDKKERG